MKIKNLNKKDTKNFIRKLKSLPKPEIKQRLSSLKVEDLAYLAGIVAGTGMLAVAIMGSTSNTTTHILKELILENI